MGEEMTMALVEWNRQLCQQPIIMSPPQQQQLRNTTATPYQPRWGDSFTPTNKNSNIRIIYQNPNGLSTSKSTDFSKTMKTIATTSSLQPDTLVYSETNIFWGNATMLHATKDASSRCMARGLYSVRTTHISFQSVNICIRTCSQEGFANG